MHCVFPSLLFAVVLSTFLSWATPRSFAQNVGLSRPPESNEQGILLRDFRPQPKLKVPSTLLEKASFPVVDVHTHFEKRFKNSQDALAAYVEAMDRNNIAICVSLDAKLGEEFQEHANYLKPYRDRFILFGYLDFQGSGKSDEPSTWDVNQPGYGKRKAAQIRVSHRIGMCGLKIFKQLGLECKNPDGTFIAIDDERFDPVWAVCGELGIPVIMHTADPSAFFDPINEQNERLEELQRHPEWHFPSPPFPSRASLHAARNRVIAKHSKTHFIAAHLGNDAEDLLETQAWLDRYPNLYVEIASRISELGRQPRQAQAFIEKNADRILFGTDGPWPEKRLRSYWRFLETQDENFPYSEKEPPPQGLWNIYGVALTEETLQKVYHHNASRLIPGVQSKLEAWLARPQSK